MPATTSETLDLVDRTVSVAPMVLLSVADHYGRSAQGTKKRVVGVLLGQNDSKGIRVSNSFGGASSGWPGDERLTFVQFHSRRTTRTPPCGSSTTTTSSL
jgi:26S proteasome regulatory subunit N8